MNSSSKCTVTVVDYDPTWPAQFETLKARILPALGDIAVSVEHVGSTAIAGLTAKPIIDMDVIVASAADAPLALERLAVLGYRHQGNLGIAGREAFESPPGFPAHHLYVCIQDSIALQNHLTIRDCLRHDRQAVVAYGALKKRLAAEFPNDASRYAQEKTDFLLEILRKTGLPCHILTAIESVNHRSR